MNRLERLQLQSKQRNQARPNKDYMPINMNRSIDTVAPPDDRGQYRELLQGRQLIGLLLAISYRKDLPPGSTKAGVWKQFKTPYEANSWLSRRASAGAAVYTGRALFYHFEQVLEAWEDPAQVPTLARGIKNYFDWRLKNGF